MCGIAGFFNAKADYLSFSHPWTRILTDMQQALFHRGPDQQGEFLEKTVGLCHTGLSILDTGDVKQPFIKKENGKTYVILLDGELYNAPEIKADLLSKGCTLDTKTHAELILQGFLEYGTDIVKKLNGVFAFAIWSKEDNQLYLFRDPLGIKPLFYTISQGTLVFGSEIKALFTYPHVTPQVDQEGLLELFALGPAKTHGVGVFKNIYEVLPAQYIVFSEHGLLSDIYWKLQSKPHTESYEETVEHTSFLVQDAIRRQMISDVPICTFLSGGIDSSIVSAVCAQKLAQEGKQLMTFSFDFDGNKTYFKSNAFQPELDRPWVDKMIAHIKSNHIYLECSTVELADYLYTSVDAKDLPGMGDVDSSLLYFCSKVKDYSKVALTGECADEVFGGYPWFHKKEFFDAHTFPWSRNTEIRRSLLLDSLLPHLPLEEYIQKRYEEALLETPLLEGETAEQNRRREISYLNLRWFMATLINRMDRASMYAGLVARVPFADIRIVEYLWNVPWEMKAKDGVVKGLLRESSKDILPHDVLYRKKSPYPKTYHPQYEKLLGDRLMEVLHDPNAPLRHLVDKEKVKKFIETPSDYGKPWYGQLMAGPQMLAYLLQLNYWLDKYHVQILLP